MNLPVARASTVVFESIADMEAVQKRFDADEPVPTYGIANMPLRVAFEELMVELEGGHRAVTLPSGLAAVAAAILAAREARATTSSSSTASTARRGASATARSSASASRRRTSIRSWARASRR